MSVTGLGERARQAVGVWLAVRDDAIVSSLRACVSCSFACGDVFSGVFGGMDISQTAEYCHGVALIRALGNKVQPPFLQRIFDALKTGKTIAVIFMS